jgi:hypothetical protein
MKAKNKAFDFNNGANGYFRVDQGTGCVNQQLGLAMS